MTGSDFPAQYFQTHQRFIQGLKAADNEVITDSQHLEKIRKLHKDFCKQISSLVKKHFPLCPKVEQKCSAQMGESGSRLENIQFNGQVLVLEGHQGQNKPNRNPMYTGPEVVSEVIIIVSTCYIHSIILTGR